MSESRDIFKILIFIGIVLFFASIVGTPWIYVGSPIPSGSTWGQMQTQLGSFPTFNNPFGAQNVNFDMLPSGQRANGSTPSYVVNGSASSFWRVLADGNESTYVGMNAALTTLRFNMSIVPGNYLLTAFSVEIWCRSNGTTGYFWPEFQNQADTADLVMYLTTSNDVVTCAPGPAWTKTVVGGQNAEGLSMGNVSQLIFRIHKSDQNAVDRSTPAMEFAFVHMTVTGIAVTTCSAPPGAWFPWADNLACAVSQGLVAIWRGFGMFVGGLIFIGQALFWFVGIIGIFFSSILVLFTGPSGSSTPPQVAGLLGILILGLVVYVALYFFGKVRGTGNVG